MKKNENDLKILEAIIAEQNAKGAQIPKDADDLQYTWNKEGRLTELFLDRFDLSGHLSLAGLDALEILYCSHNRITELDVSRNPELKYLYCYDNALESLDISACPKLEFLRCYKNRLKRLDVSANSALDTCCFDEGMEILREKEETDYEKE